jgi:hypothetical protein
MVEVFAVIGLAIACGVWVLVDRANGGCGQSGRCGSSGGGSCSRKNEPQDADA